MLRERVWRCILERLNRCECEVEPMSMKYRGIVNLLNIGNFEGLLMEIIGRNNCKIVGDDVLNNRKLLINYYNNKLQECLKKRVYEWDVMNKYILNCVDLEQIPYSYSFYGGEFLLEDVKKYVYEKYGQKKLDEKRKNAEKKRNAMIKMYEDKREKNELARIKRKGDIYDILAEFNLYYSQYMWEAERYIEKGGELDIKKMLEEAKNMNDYNRNKESHKERFYEKLQENGLMDMKYEDKCKKYAKSANGVEIEDFIEDLKEDRFLRMNTIYPEIDFNRIEKWMPIKDYYRLERTREDIFKTFAVEKWLIKLGWDFGKMENYGEFPKKIQWRIEEVFRVNEKK